MNHKDQFDLNAILHNLANERPKRPIFHSECDFQHALAWKIHEHHQNYQIRLEYPVRNENPDVNNGHFDIFIRNNEEKFFIELKYKTAELHNIEINNELFNLTRQKRHPETRKDFLKDIKRIETAIRTKGFVIFLTNDHLYWQEERKNILLNQGQLNTNGYEGQLNGNYEGLSWGEEDYSNFDNQNGKFRYLIIEI
jgi:hypothetical protein